MIQPWMHRMIKIFQGILFILLCANVYAKPFSQLIFFGDSMTDNGNLYSTTVGIFPPSPPYFEGRFLNGQTWAEQVGSFYQKEYKSAYSIYAVGGATAEFHLPSKYFIAPSFLGMQVSQYLLSSLFKERTNSLFIIWIGANDYIFFPHNYSLSSKSINVVKGVTNAIQRLINHGARNFLILNLIDASRAPYFQDIINRAKALHRNIYLYNSNMEIEIAKLIKKYPDTHIQIFNTYDFFNDYIDHYQKYNRQYHLHIADTIHSCLKTTSSFINSFKKKILGAHDPINPCANPNTYIYWDHLHLTEPFHQILSQLIINKINNY